MKKLLLPVLFTFFINTYKAQTYSFSLTTATYTALTGSTSINGTTVWSPYNSYAVPIGFNFSFMGNTYDTIYIEGSGFTRFDANYRYLLLPFAVTLKDKGTATSLSPLSYKVDGNSPNRILKIEWNNCAFKNDPSPSDVNFQLWLYETSNIIESHIGNINTSNPSQAYSGHGSQGAQVGIYKFQSSTFCQYGLTLTGNPSSATAVTINNSILSNIFSNSLNGTPSQSIVYRFTPLATDISDNKTTDGLLEVYPNPSSGIIYLQTNALAAGQVKISISDIKGSVVYSEVYNAAVPAKIDLSNLPKGVYLLQIENHARISNRKLILN